MKTKHQAGTLATGRGQVLAASSKALDRELIELEKRKLVALNNGSVRLTREGYLEISRRFPRGRR